MYRIVTEDGDDNIVVPPSLMPELRKLPDDVLSFPKAVERVNDHYTIVFAVSLMYTAYGDEIHRDVSG